MNIILLGLWFRKLNQGHIDSSLRLLILAVGVSILKHLYDILKYFIYILGLLRLLLQDILACNLMKKLLLRAFIDVLWR